MLNDSVKLIAERLVTFRLNLPSELRTQQALCNKMGITNSLISRAESQDKPRPGSQKRLIAYYIQHFGVSKDDFDPRFAPPIAKLSQVEENHQLLHAQTKTVELQDKMIAILEKRNVELENLYTQQEEKIKQLTMINIQSEKKLEKLEKLLKETQITVTQYLSTGVGFVSEPEKDYGLLQNIVKKINSHATHTFH